MLRLLRTPLSLAAMAPMLSVMLLSSTCARDSLPEVEDSAIDDSFRCRWRLSSLRCLSIFGSPAS